MKARAFSIAWFSLNSYLTYSENAKVSMVYANVI